MGHNVPTQHIVRVCGHEFPQIGTKLQNDWTHAPNWNQVLSAG